MIFLFPHPQCHDNPPHLLPFAPDHARTSAQSPNPTTARKPAQSNSKPARTAAHLASRKTPHFCSKVRVIAKNGTKAHTPKNHVFSPKTDLRNPTKHSPSNPTNSKNDTHNRQTGFRPQNHLFAPRCAIAPESAAIGPTVAESCAKGCPNATKVRVSVQKCSNVQICAQTCAKM